MIRSMTGYGKAEISVSGAGGETAAGVEIKSVNHRYNDISIKLPRGMAEFEDSVKKQLLKEITRGKTDLYISFETFSKNDVTVKFNENVAEALTEHLKTMKERFSTTDGVSLNILTRFPEILSVDRSSLGDEAKEVCLLGITEAVKTALFVFISMREKEGASLKKDILSKLSGIKSLLDAITSHAPKVAEMYREKLLLRISEIKSNIGSDLELDEAKIMNEVLFFADRACIDEEITRLKSHSKQMASVLTSGEAAGRKLDFIAQEMNREINTIGSKSNDLEITSAVVELKSELEKIREQIQNIE